MVQVDTVYGVVNAIPEIRAAMDRAGHGAMLMVDTIASLGANGGNKADVLKALFAIKDRNSVLGTYGFDTNGDTTLKSYGLYSADKSGNLVFKATLTPTETVK